MFDLALGQNSELPVRWVPHDQGFGSTFSRPEESLFRIRTDNVTPVLPPPLPALTRDIKAIDLSNAAPKLLQLTQNAEGTPFSLGINGVPGDKAAPVMATMGETQIWTVQNTIQFAHPFHLQGFFFQVLDVNGVAPALREWRDTVDVPVDATVRLAMTFDERPGMWMFHCHILDHSDAGMMGMVHLLSH